MKPLLFFSVSLLFIPLLSCQEKTPDIQTSTPSETRKIYVGRSSLFDNYSDQKLQVADFVELYFNLMYDSTLEDRNALWDSKILTHQQDFFLKGNFEKGFFFQYAPQILGIRAMSDNRYEVKLEVQQSGITFKIMNLIVAFDGLNRPYFIDQFGENLTEFDAVRKETLTFLYSKKAAKNDSLEQKMVHFNQKLATLFNISPKSTSVIVLKNLKDYCDVIGYDYMTFLTHDVQTGGIALPEEQILFSANNSPYYPHELVHIYTADQDPHYWFDEGCATYLGGSVEYPLEHHLKKVAAQMDSLDFSELPKDQKLDDETSLKYSLGGLFCKLAMEEFGGRESLLILLNSGKTEENFHAALKAVFGIEQKDYDAFVKEKLRKYKG